jgi:hypothetical protein
MVLESTECAGSACSKVLDLSLFSSGKTAPDLKPYGGTTAMWGPATSLGPATGTDCVLDFGVHFFNESVLSVVFYSTMI